MAVLLRLTVSARDFYGYIRAEEDSAFVTVRDETPEVTSPDIPEVALEALTRVPPEYPNLARQAGVDGTVVVRALVGTDGLVKSTRIVKSIPMLDAAAERAVRQWRFKPAMRGAVAVWAWTTVPVRFTLD